MLFGRNNTAVIETTATTTQLNNNNNGDEINPNLAILFAGNNNANAMTEEEPPTAYIFTSSCVSNSGSGSVGGGNIHQDLAFLFAGNNKTTMTAMTNAVPPPRTMLTKINHDVEWLMSQIEWDQSNKMAKSGGCRIKMIVDPMFFAQNHLMANGGDKEIPMWARR